MLETLPTFKSPIILDGGLSNELEAQGYDLNGRSCDLARK